MGSELPQELSAFLVEYISSVVQLEALLLRRTGSEWSGEALAGELRIEPQPDVEQLSELCHRGLVPLLYVIPSDRVRHHPRGNHRQESHPRAVGGREMAQSAERCMKMGGCAGKIWRVTGSTLTSGVGRV
jgi:hypothetical protein